MLHFFVLKCCLGPEPLSEDVSIGTLNDSEAINVTEGLVRLTGAKKKLTFCGLYSY